MKNLNVFSLLITSILLSSGIAQASTLDIRHTFSDSAFSHEDWNDDNEHGKQSSDREDNEEHATHHSSSGDDTEEDESYFYTHHNSGKGSSHEFGHWDHQEWDDHHGEWDDHHGEWDDHHGEEEHQPPNIVPVPGAFWLLTSALTLGLSTFRRRDTTNRA